MASTTNMSIEKLNSADCTSAVEKGDAEVVRLRHFFSFLVVLSDGV